MSYEDRRLADLTKAAATARTHKAALVDVTTATNWPTAAELAATAAAEAACVAADKALADYEGSQRWLTPRD
jgi:hypothetical protein